MKYTEKENTKQLDNKKEQSMNNIITLAFNFIKFHDEEKKHKEYKYNVIKEFESCSLEVQILTLDYISDLFIKEYRTNRFYDLGQKHVNNFIELWNVLKSEDAKYEFAYKIDNNTVRFNDSGILQDSLIYKFYNNKHYEEFMSTQFSKR